MSVQDLPGSLIWATRGRFWGFRFLLNGGRSDPLLDYERSFADLKDEPTTWRRAAGQVALRFPDPLERKDAAGRVIPHEFVVSGDLADEIESVEDGLQQIWPLVAGAYARVWDTEGPPSVADLGFTTHDNSPLDP
ncbi:hypothetical protein E0H73_32710 [Kribbella pittospori]|uniref:Uncharacterized protein n=1 Tax=Kribbella pittospori TaxID=722689 RepID=A0A4R0KL35_9ACTN|nr:hypothetical protein [Kribbella pittospori]TCC56445.1 hypothetical protein E0H73_32710 [Kribbella pittospori]